MGDIACDPSSSSFNGGAGTSSSCQQKATSDLVVGGGYEAFLGLGDLQYEDGTFSEFMGSYDLSWGRVKNITKPVVGNHEYNTSGASGYYQYFGAAAGDPSKGYYSYDVGAWHVVALNSNCEEVSCSTSSAQTEWLRDDLAAHPTKCAIAYWHHPRFSSGDHGDDSDVAPLYQAAYDAGVDVALVGHDHNYERFARQSPAGVADPARGIRQFVVGTGGKSLRALSTLRPNSEVRNTTTYGVLELTLHATSFEWRFVPRAGATFSDSGTEACH